MPKYKFEIQAHAEITVEADTAEEARMKLIEDHELYEEMLIDDDHYISGGEEV